METIPVLHMLLFSFGKKMDVLLEEQLDISLPQIMMLVAIKHHHEGNQVMVAKFRHLTPAAISKQVQTLSKKGLIIKKQNPTSRREHILIVTRRGENLLKRGKVLFDAEQKIFFNRLSARDRTEFDRILQKLLVGIDLEIGRAFSKKL